MALADEAHLIEINYRSQTTNQPPTHPHIYPSIKELYPFC